MNWVICHYPETLYISMIGHFTLLGYTHMKSTWAPTQFDTAAIVKDKEMAKGTWYI